MNAKDAASPAKPGRPMLAMTVEEAAGVLRASPKTVMEAIRRRELSARKLGRSWRISPKALEDWLCRPEPLSPEEAGRQRALEEFRTGWHDLNAFLGRHEIPAGVFCFALEADDGSYCPVMPNGERWPLAHGRTGAPSRPRGKDEGPGSSRSPARRGGKPKRKTPGTPAGRTALRLKSSPFRQARSAPSSGRPGRLRLRTWIRSVPGPLRWTSSAAMRKAPARTGDSSSCCRNAPEGQGGGFLGAPGGPRAWTCLRTAPSLHAACRLGASVCAVFWSGGTETVAPPPETHRGRAPLENACPARREAISRGAWWLRHGLLCLHLGSGKERERGPAAPGAGPSPAGPLAPARKWFRRAGARTDWKIRRLRSAGKKHVAFASAPPSGGGGCRPSLRGAVQAGDRPSAPPALSRSLPAA